jgi:Icc-related predicted phosphoesterase
VCFRKAVNVAKHNIYNEDVVLISGDLTGKLIVPITRRDRVFETTFLGTKLVIRSEDELEDLKRRIANAGYYFYVAESREIEEIMNNHDKFQQLFSRLVVERMENWMRLAQERLNGTKVKCYVMPGNDDDPNILPILENANLAGGDDAKRVIRNPDSKVIWLDDYHEMISMGATNPTPWRTHGEFSEEELGSKIEGMIANVHDVKNLILNFHCPPYDSGLDLCPKLDNNLQPVMIGGNVVMEPAGSMAVRKAIEKHGPKLGLFGHIHESAGETHIGRTLCLNPGSEYSEGILRGYVVDLDKERILEYFRVEG